MGSDAANRGGEGERRNMDGVRPSLYEDQNLSDRTARNTPSLVITSVQVHATYLLYSHAVGVMWWTSPRDGAGRWVGSRMADC
jgi:hypothetical protein